MKLAVVEGFKAFAKQVRQNRLEMAMNLVKKNGYEVNLPKPVKVTSK